MSESSQPVPPSAEFIAQVTRAQRALHAFILSMVRNASDADDVLQETNIVLWRKAGDFDPARPFTPWAMRFAQLQSLAYVKKKQLSPVTFDDALLTLIAEEAVAEAAETDARRVALSGCLQKLNAEQRALVAQRYEPGGSVNDMAEARGTTPIALSEMLRRIRAALLACIERSLEQTARA